MHHVHIHIFFEKFTLTKLNKSTQEKYEVDNKTQRDCKINKSFKQHSNYK